MRPYFLKILTPEKKIYDGEVVSLTVTCENGQLTVLAGHAPMLAALVEGPITIQTKRETIRGTGGGGVLRVDYGEVAVLVRFLKWDGDETAEETAAKSAVESDMTL